ncbi:MAG: hypothetical protein LBG26_03285 [Treponema sp.]|nr:hypothetical protein [Treponema sp.]
MKICLCCFFFLITAVSGVDALDVYLTGIEAEFDIKPEFNRAFYYCIDTSLTGALELNNYLTLGGGFSLGGLGFVTGNGVLAYNAFGRAGFRFPMRFPLELGLSYIYNGIPDYKTGMHTMLPLLSSRWKWVGFSLGTTLRYTVYDQEAPLFEPILAFLVFANFIDTQDLRAGLRIANFSDFLAGNMGAYFLNLNVSIGLGKRLYLINEIELYQTGSVGLTSAFYGIAYRGGVKYQW